MIPQLSVSLCVRIFLFLLMFAVDVRLRAAENPAENNLKNSLETAPSNSRVFAQELTSESGVAHPDSPSAKPRRRVDLVAIQQQPEKCWQSKTACAARTVARQAARGEWNGGVISLDESTTLVRIRESELRLITGTVWLKGIENTTVRTEFGSVEIRQGSETIIIKNQDRVMVSIIQGGAEIHPIGSEDQLEVAAGFENWIGRVDSTGRAQSGIPTAVIFSPFLQTWGRLYVGNNPEFEKEAVEFYSVWQKASREAASLHRDLFLRKCASIDAEQERRRVSQIKVRARSRELIERFRRHVFDE